MATSRNKLLVLARNAGVLLSELSHADVPLLPLPDDVLTESLRTHARGVGGSEGSGKTTFIRTSYITMNKQRDQGKYRVLPIREHSTAKHLIDSLILYDMQQASTTPPSFLHVDVAHDVTTKTDALLFSLVVSKVLRDRKSCRALAIPRATVFVEFAAEHAETHGDEANSQNWSTLLPLTQVYANQRKHLPIFKDAHDGDGLALALAEDCDAIYVAKYLRALRDGKLNPHSGQFVPEFMPSSDAAISQQEVYAIVFEAVKTQLDPSPSFGTMRIFIRMMKHLLSLADVYGVPRALANDGGGALSKLWHCVTSLLAATSRDFAQRAIPRGDQFNARRLLPTDDTSRNLMQANQFERMASWQDGDHPIFLFYGSERDEGVSGMEFIAKCQRSVQRYLDAGLCAELRLNRIQLLRDWARLDTREYAEIVRRVEGFRGADFRADEHRGATAEQYVLTLDNLLKMLSIQLRWKARLPVLMSGETGCGKSSLIQQLCFYLGYSLRTLNVHGGVDDSQVLTWVNVRVHEALSHTNMRFVWFFDELNTCESLALFKSILIDRLCDGKQVPKNVLLVAACNPYRQRNAMVSTVTYEHTGI
ncbi:MAG: hypothetical protein MHM6MM_005738 [Cercozoa sp. M6MM]